MIKNIKERSEVKMDNCISILMNNFNTLRTDRASPSILNSIYINYFGNNVQLCKLANIIVENFNTLKINLFDIAISKNVQTAIINSNLGLNPITIGNDLKIILPALTEEKRKNYIKLAKNFAEKSRICIRNIRRNSNEQIKRALKEKLISNDIERDLQNYIQRLTNSYISKISKVLKTKEHDLMNI
ncbi:MAG: ribosome recycling factor [Buchnera aphidicola (Nurudea yanoniella)]